MSNVLINRELAENTVKNIKTNYRLFDMKNWLVPGHEYGTAGCLGTWICITAYELELPEDLKGCPISAEKQSVYFLTGRTHQQLISEDPELLFAVWRLFYTLRWSLDLQRHSSVALGRKNAGFITTLELQKMEADLACEALMRVVDKYAPNDAQVCAKSEAIASQELLALSPQ